MRYSRPLMISSKRCSFTFCAGATKGVCKGAVSLAPLRHHTSERTIEGASTECTGGDCRGVSVKISMRCRPVHRRSTILQHLFNRPGSRGAFDKFCRAAGVIALVLFADPAVSRVAAASDLYRLFLLDGGTLVSYGEFARVGDRVVLSIPIGALSDTPDLQLVSIPQATVDWERTDRYADTVRARRYGETRGESDFALLGARVVEALNLISLTEDPARRLAMAQEARQNLVRWPVDNFGYRAQDVAQLTGMLDDVIADLRVAAGETTRVSLVANTIPIVEPVIAPPDLRETMEQALAAATLTPEPTERISLLRAIGVALQDVKKRDSWASVLAARAASDLAGELRVEKAYSTLSSSTLTAASTRAARGDLRGVQDLVEGVLKADDRLGRKRPQNTSALLATLEWRLAEAARVRLAQDAWTARLSVLRTYRQAIRYSVQALRDSTKWLLEIRERQGPSPEMLPRMEQRLVMARQMLDGIRPPAELDAAHALFRAAFQMASRAASARRNAVSSNNTSLVWDAASAAAGALMLRDRASEELDRLTSPSAKH